MGKWFLPNAVRRSHSLEGTKRPLIGFLLLFNKHNWDQLEIHTHPVKYPDLLSAVRSVPQSEEFLCTKAPEKLDF